MNLVKVKDFRMNREVLRLSIPSILANITVPLVGMVDISVAGHLHGDQAISTAAFIGGISIGTMLFDLLYWSFAFLRVSTGGLVAQAFGRNDARDCGTILLRSVLLSLVSTLLIVLVQWPFRKAAIAMSDCSAPVAALATRYFLIRIWAAPATLSLMALRGFFVGMQDSVSSMCTDLTVNIVNIVSSIVLSLGFGGFGPSGVMRFGGLGFDGIALGTVIAQYSGLLFALAVVAFKYLKKIFPDGLRAVMPEVLDKARLRRFMSMNSDLFVRSLCFIAIYVGFTMISSHYGDLMLSACSIIMKILMLFSFFTDGFAYAGEALTGRFIGAEDREGLRLSVKTVFAWSMGVAVLFMFIYGFGGRAIASIMTSDPDVVAACMSFMPWLLLMPPLGCAAFTWDGVYQGATATSDVRDAMIWAAASFFSIWFVLSRLLRAWASMSTYIPDGKDYIHVLMAAYFAHLLARTVLLSIRWRKVSKNLL